MQELSFPERFSSNRCSLSSWERPWKSLLAFVHLSHGWLHPSWGSAEQCWPSMPGRLCNPSTWPCTCSQKHPWMNQGMAISLLFFFFPLPPPLKSYDCLGWKGSLSTPTPCYRAGTPPSRAGSSIVPSQCQPMRKPEAIANLEHLFMQLIFLKRKESQK